MKITSHPSIKARPKYKEAKEKLIGQIKEAKYVIQNEIQVYKKTMEVFM
jgi:hypothetical protein